LVVIKKSEWIMFMRSIVVGKPMVMGILGFEGLHLLAKLESLKDLWIL